MEFLVINKSVSPVKISKLNVGSVGDAINTLREKEILNFDLYLNINDKDLPSMIQRLEQLEETVITLQSLLKDKINANEEPQSLFSPINNITVQEKPKQESKSVIVELLNKKLQKANPTAGRYEDKMYFSLTFLNLTTRHIRAIKGDIVFSDLFKSDIFRVSVTVNQKISPRGDTKWEGEMTHNNFIPEHVHFAGFNKEDLKVRLEDESIVFA